MEEKPFTGTPVILTGTYDRQNYRNEKNGYTLFTIRTKEECPYRDNFGSVRCAGNIPAYPHGMPLKITGYWENTGFGPQLHIQSVEEMSDSETVTAKYLTEICAGIGDAAAWKIVKTTGADIFGFVQRPDAEEQLKKCVSNINASALIRAVRSSVEQRKVFEFILRYGGTYPNAVRICNEYGSNTLVELKKNPYRAGLKNGLTFEQCDSIAKDQQIDAYDRSRIMALIQEAMNRIINSGHTYTTLASLTAMINYIAKKSSYGNEMPSVLVANTLARNHRYVLEMGAPIRIYYRKLWEAEQEIIKNINRIGNSSISTEFDERLIAEIEKELGITYGDDQKECFNILKTTGIKILTGGPGTGKTTVINGLISGFKILKPHGGIALCAPTGRAAQRMSEATGLDASTIHRLLDYRPYGEDCIYRNQSDPIPADFIIVDEISMADTQLMAMLLGASKSGSLILLVGDEDQLESVGPGNVLHDLLKSGKIETYRLVHNRRQKNESLIVQNALKVNGGRSDITEGPEFEVYSTANCEEAREKVKELVLQYHVKNDPFHLQVLTPVRKTKAGAYELNNMLQEALNVEKQRINFGNVSFRLHDKVMMLSNNYEKRYFNGDIGTVVDISEGHMKVNIGGNIIELDRTLLEDVCLCYASTIHKAQGSEYPVVIGVLTDEPAVMLKRNLLYTLLTRAKDKVVLVVVKDAFRTAVKNDRHDKRNTGLLDKLNGNCTQTIPVLNRKTLI